jgi:hypothetical protein
VWLDFFSRGDTQEFSDLYKLAKRFLKGSHKPKKGKLKMSLHELIFKRSWKTCIKGKKESVRYVLKHSKMQY